MRHTFFGGGQGAVDEVGGLIERGTQATHGPGLAMVRRLMEVPARKLRRAKLLVAEAAASDAAEANVGVCCKNCGAAALDSQELVDASTQWDIRDAATAEQMGCSDYIAQPLPKQKMSKHKMPKPPQCAPPNHMVMKLLEKASPPMPPGRGIMLVAKAMLPPPRAKGKVAKQPSTLPPWGRSSSSTSNSNRRKTNAELERTSKAAFDEYEQAQKKKKRKAETQDISEDSEMD